MPVPDHRDVPRQLFDTGLYNLTTHDGQGAFVDAVVSTLHAFDARWGHLKKKPGQTAIHGHGEDAALYLADEPGQSQAVDFVGGAGGPNPQPAWQVDPPRYSASDWLDPTLHAVSIAPPPPPPPPQYPSYEELGGDEGGKKITRQLEADYKRAGRPSLDGNCGAWQQRVSYDFLTGICKTVEESITKHRAKWCAELGIPVE